MTIELMQQPKYPAEIIAIALNLTMKSDPTFVPAKFTEKLGKFLLDADHTSPLEHINYTILIQNVSRSFLAQITRHRMGSFTSASQHYQYYDDYPVIMEKYKEEMEFACQTAFTIYRSLVDKGVRKEEARQVLPNAAAVNLLWTVNARSLINFFRQRLCLRNVKEMRMFAQRLLSLAEPTFPELFKHVGPQCYEGKCKQGKMSCGIGPWVKWNKKEK